MIAGAGRAAAEAAQRVVDEVGRTLADGLHARQSQSRRIEKLEALDSSRASGRGALARRWRDEIGSIERMGLAPELALDLDVAAVTVERLSLEAESEILVHDPLGLGFFGRFGPAAYSGGWWSSTALGLLRRAPLDTAADRECYLGLVGDYAAAIRAMAARLRRQAAEGIRVPRPQLAASRSLIRGMRAQACDALVPDAARLRAVGTAFADACARRTAQDVSPAFEELHAVLDEDYERAAPADVGLGHVAGGAALYERLVRHYTTLPLTPEQVHRTGLERISTLAEQMRAVRSEAGFTGDDRAYVEAIATLARWRVRDPAEIATAFGVKLRHLAPQLERVFRLTPRSPAEAAPLPEALEPSMTYGYYQHPTAPGAPGRYLFNAANLAASGTARVAALCFHELVPGHHVHFATQLENEALPDVRRFNSFNAFNEGWAEYAAQLAGELDGYEAPEERFGRLMMDALLTSRLVVDTGLNAFGWSLDDARRYLRGRAFMPENEVHSETLRYSCDLPGQALAYKLGDTFLLAQRERMRAALGDSFDLRDFHDAVLGPGALPLPMVADRVAAAIAAARRDPRASSNR